jgi:hypothetical protein
MLYIIIWTNGKKSYRKYFENKFDAEKFHEEKCNTGSYSFYVVINTFENGV